MTKILHTGDLHLGREYSKYGYDISEKYKNARIEALEKIINLSVKQECDYIVISGDLFDKRSVPDKLIKMVCKILGTSPSHVIVIPGNHDYYENNDDKLWSKFREYASGNTTLLCKNEPIKFDNIIFYPAVCNNRTSEENALGWLKEYKDREPELINIGIAHGAIEGLSYDKENKYYYMSMSELKECNMDLWLIGHTHIPYPDLQEVKNNRIFNAGTHQQTDIADNAKGSVFIIDIDENKNVEAHMESTGVIRFVQESVEIKHGEKLKDRLEKITEKYDKAKTSIRIYINGIATLGDYEQKQEIYDDFKKEFLYFKSFDTNLQPEITEDQINEITIDGSLENKLLMKYKDEPEMLNLAYQLVKECKEEK